MATKPITYVPDSKGRAVIDKDPDAVLDYSFDWGPWLQPLGVDSIVAHEFIPEGTLVIDSSANDASTATAWVSGGTKGETHRLTCRITTADGRTDDRSVFLKVLER